MLIGKNKKKNKSAPKVHTTITKPHQNLTVLLSLLRFTVSHFVPQFYIKSWKNISSFSLSNIFKIPLFLFTFLKKTKRLRSSQLPLDLNSFFFFIKTFHFFYFAFFFLLKKIRHGLLQFFQRHKTKKKIFFQ